MAFPMDKAFNMGGKWFVFDKKKQTIVETDHPYKTEILELECMLCKLSDAIKQSTSEPVTAKMTSATDSINQWKTVLEQTTELLAEELLKEIKVIVDTAMEPPSTCPPRFWPKVGVAVVPRGSGQPNMTIAKSMQAPPQPAGPPPPELLKKAALARPRSPPKSPKTLKRDLQLAAAKEAEASLPDIKEWAAETWDRSALVEKVTASSSGKEPPKEKTAEEAKKQADRKDRQRVKKELKKQSDHEPTEEEVRQFIINRNKSPMFQAKAKAQPKRLASETPTDAVPPAKSRTIYPSGSSDKSERDSNQASGSASGSGYTKVNPDPASSQAGGSCSGSAEVKPDPASCQAGGSDEEGGSDGNDVPKNVLNCQNAKECEGYQLKWSQFLLCDAEASWSGQIYGWCQPCSGLTPKDFHKQAKKAKRARVALKKEHQYRSRNMTFDNQAEFVRKLFPNASHTKQRELAVSRMRACTTAYVLSYDRMNKFAQEAYKVATQQWLADADKAASDPSFACKTDARTLTAEECSYLSNIGEGMYWSYLCRKEACLYFGRNCIENWAKHNVKYQFRCACCGAQHQPWAGDEETTVKAAMVLTLVNPITMVTQFIPCINPASEDEKWINNQVEIAARAISTEADLNKWYERSALDLSNLLAREALPASEVFRRIPYDPSKHEYKLDETAWNTEPMRRNGYVVGNFLPKSALPRDPFSDFNGLIAVMANHCAAARAFLSKL